MDIKTILKNSRATINKDDLDILFKSINGIEIKRVLEIGTDQGFSAELWKNAFNPEKLVTVELHDKPYFIANNRPVVEFEGINYLWGYNSLDQKTIEKVKSLCPEYDFVFIDGDHSYKMAKYDWENYGSLCRKGGVVVFHDVSVYHYELVVRPLWEQLKDKYSHVEILRNRETSTGLGVLFI